MRVPGLFRVLVWDVHLRERALVHDRTDLTLVFEADHAEHRPLAWIEPEAEAPVLPAYEALVDSEARADRLRYVDRLGAWHGFAAHAVVNAGRWGRGNKAVVDDARNLFRAHVRSKEDAADLAVPGAGDSIHGVHAPAESNAILRLLLLRQREVAAGNYVAGDEAKVCQSALLQGLHEARIFLHLSVYLFFFSGCERTVLALQKGEALGLLRHNVYESGIALALIDQHHIGLALDGIARLPAQHVLLFRFVQQDASEEGLFVQVAFSLKGLVDRPIFLRCQCIERMLHRWCNGLCGEGEDNAGQQNAGQGIGFQSAFQNLSYSHAASTLRPRPPQRMHRGP